MFPSERLFLLDFLLNCWMADDSIGSTALEAHTCMSLQNKKLQENLKKRKKRKEKKNTNF